MLVDVVEVDAPLSGRKESQHRLLLGHQCWHPAPGHGSEVGNFKNLSDHCVLCEIEKVNVESGSCGMCKLEVIQQNVFWGRPSLYIGTPDSEEVSDRRGGLSGVLSHGCAHRTSGELDYHKKKKRHHGSETATVIFFFFHCVRKRHSSRLPTSLGPAPSPIVKYPQQNHQNKSPQSISETEKQKTKIESTPFSYRLDPRGPQVLAYSYSIFFFFFFN